MRRYLRDVALFVVGVATALTFSRPGQAQDDRLTGIRMNHVGIVAKDWQTTLDFYLKTLGFREAFTFKDKDGNINTSYIQMSKEDFLEIIRPTAPNTPGVNHVGIWVDDIRATDAKLRKKGVKVEDIRIGNSKAPLANFTDPNGVRIELLKYPAESWQKQAMDAWR